MLGPIGAQELIIIFVIALIVFGPRKLPELGKQLGRSIGEFKRASNELRSTLEQEIRVEETRKEIMEPIETISSEAKKAVKNATELDVDNLTADVDDATGTKPAVTGVATGSVKGAVKKTADADLPDSKAQADASVVPETPELKA
jgi:TatA/E family protein of Tat protein translocase